MSELRVDSVKSKGGGAPDLPKGVTISGITTAATLGATQIDVSNVNVSGVVTSATLNGELLSTGTPTLGLGVTINSSGVAISGVATAGIVSATTLYGDGTNITGLGATLAPLFYNPDTSDSSVSFGTGIGITFNQQIKAGTGNITIREGSSSGTVVENFGVGSSVTISENRVTFTPSSDLSEGVVYHLSYPSGCFTNNEGTDYVGTAYTFKALGYDRQLWTWGYNYNGQLGQNIGGNPGHRSSPVQVPGTTWSKLSSTFEGSIGGGIKTDGTLWLIGTNTNGELGQNDVAARSSPIQIPGTTWSEFAHSNSKVFATKTDGTAWAWGRNQYGELGQNDKTSRSSPTQIGSGTDWSTARSAFGTNNGAGFGVKSDGTAWAWGRNEEGQLGLNNKTLYSSPVQIPGTTWKMFSASDQTTMAIKTNGTLWGWGRNEYGDLGLNSAGDHGSSPRQVPGTTWSYVSTSTNTMSFATKTDGTLWAWGKGYNGQLGINVSGNPGPGSTRSSPTQIPGTTWTDQLLSINGGMCVKTDGTLWMWGRNGEGLLGQNDTIEYSSPVQVPGTTWTKIGGTIQGIRQTSS